MFFVVDKAILQRMISIARDDKASGRGDNYGPFSHLEGVDNELAVSMPSPPVYCDGIFVGEGEAARQFAGSLPECSSSA